MSNSCINLKVNMFVFIISMCLFTLGYDSFPIMTTALFTLFLSNIIYSLRKLKRRFFFGSFTLSVFLFLIGRPFFRLFELGLDNEWYEYGNIASRSAIFLIYLSLFSLIIGQFIGERLNFNLEYRTIEYKRIINSNTCRRWQKFSKYFFYVTIFFKIIVELERLLYMGGREYAEVYATFASNLPAVIHGLAGLNVYFLCMYLATLPVKKKAVITILLYVFTTVPWLIIGARNFFVSALVFMFSYMFIRYLVTPEEEWFGKKEKNMMVLLLPLGIFFLGAYNYLREFESSVDIFNISIFLDFVIKQGVSFNTLCLGMESIRDIKDLGDKYYLFGPLIDYLKYGVLGQVIFDNHGLPAGNSMEMIQYGHSMAHDLSYLTRDDYLDGHGFGSSYIFEVFYDFGLFGLAFYNIFLGFLFSQIIRLCLSGYLNFTILLVIFTSIFMAPRSSASDFLTFIVKYQFWISILSIYILISLCKKSIINHNNCNNDSGY